MAHHDQKATSAKLLGDMRGNVGSPAALASAFYALRLYRVVQAALEHKMSSVAWPVWGATLSELHRAANDVERRGLYRLPVLFRHSVQLVVYVTIVYDVFVLGTVVGRLFHQDYNYAWFSTICATLTMLVVVSIITLVVSVSQDMVRALRALLTSLCGTVVNVCRQPSL